MGKGKKHSQIASQDVLHEIPSMKSVSKLTDVFMDKIPPSHSKSLKEEELNALIAAAKLKLEVGMQDMKNVLENKISDLTDDILNITSESSLGKKKPFQRPIRKVFSPRESILSTMLDHHDENYRTIFNIALCVLILWGLQLAFDDYTSSGLPNFDLLTWGIFRDIGSFFYYWSIMLSCTFVIIPLAHFAAETKSKTTFFLINFLYGSIQVLAFIFSALVVNSSHKQFAMPLAMGFMAEQARMSMKMHSYYREKVVCHTNNYEFVSKPQTWFRIPFVDLSFPTFSYFFSEISRFSLFHFAPTLLFRDSYPRLSKTNWQNVVMRLLEAWGIVYFAFLIFRETLPKFSDNFGRKLGGEEFIRLTFQCM